MEEIQRTTGLIRALGGVIVGGTSTSTLPAGVALEIATSSDVLLSGENQLLRFSGGHASNYVGFRATTTLTTTTVYTWPSVYGSTGQALVTTEDGGLSWSTPAGMGSITKIGDVIELEAFTTSTVAGTSLWFHNNGNMGQLTIGTLTGNKTYTLPDLTGTIALQAESNLSVSGGVVFADSLGRLIQDSNFTWSTSSLALELGSASNAGQLRIYSSHAGGYYLGFRATSTMAGNTEYYWPAGYGASANSILMADTSGNLRWGTPGEGGAVEGAGVSGQVTFWDSTKTVTGSDNLFWATSTNRLGIGTATPAYTLDLVGTARISNSLIVPLIQSAGALTLEALGGDILLNPSTGIVQLATSTYIRTQEGYEIGRTGTEILREMIPIMGFDLPVQTATTSYIQVSRTLEDYPFSTAATGTARVHKLVFRYAASTTADIDVQVATSSGAYSSFKLPQPETANLDRGEAYIATTTIPTDNTDWWVEIKTPTIPDTVRIFQIFLAAYDQIQ